MRDKMIRVDWLVTEMNVLGGAETFIRIAAPRMRNLGWDLHVITFSQGGVLVDQLRAEGVPVFELGLNFWNILPKAIRLLSIWKKDKPRLLHAHLFHAGIIGRIAGKLIGIHPVIVHQAGPELSRSKLRTGLDRYTSFLVDQYITSCAAVEKILVTREHIAKDKIVVIPSGILINPSQRSNSRPESWLKNASGTILGVVSRLAPEKGHHLLLDALSILYHQEIKFHAIMVGDGIMKEELIQKTKALHLENHITWVGTQTNIPDWLPFFDLFIMPSHWEGISLALLEAMSAGLPVVATRVGGNPEVVVQDVTGLLVPPSNPHLLADAIRLLISNPSLRLEMGKAGRTRCEQNFDIDSSVKRIDSLYHQRLKSDQVRQ